MKKLLLLLLLLSCVSISAQEKWRTLTLSTTNGLSMNGEFITTSSMNISYELNKGYSIESWSGFNYNAGSKYVWMSNQTTLNKSFKHLTVGVGVLYTQGGDGTLGNVINKSINTFGVVTISKRFKL